MAELYQWTESAARLLRQELERKKFSVVDRAPKSLRLSVTNATATDSVFTIRSIVTLSIETGDGEVGSFIGENKSPWSLMRAVDGALMFAVYEALNSDLVIDYLTSSEDTTKVTADAAVDR